MSGFRFKLLVLDTIFLHYIRALLLVHRISPCENTCTLIKLVSQSILIELLLALTKIPSDGLEVNFGSFQTLSSFRYLLDCVPCRRYFLVFVGGLGFFAKLLITMY